MSDVKVVTVEIHGQRYSVRSTLDPAYVAELAAYVDEKMRTAADETGAADSLKVAVLAALNVADELFHIRGTALPASRVIERAQRLEQLVDAALSGGD